VVILPIGHDRAIYDKPVLTLGIIGTCTAIQVLRTIMHFMGMTGAVGELHPSDPITWLGFVPANGVSIGLVTSAFVHGGYLHLVGNMIFLWLTGANMEYRWGWKVWGGLYLVGSIVSAGTFGVLHPDAAVPLVGASGAVAAAMGAFLVCLYKARIKLWYLYFIFLVPRSGTFHAPAYVALPLWFALQLFHAYFFESSSGGVAYSAHVGGFVLGASVAALLQLTGYESKLRAAVGSDVFDEYGAFLDGQRPVVAAAREPRFAVAHVPVGPSLPPAAAAPSKPPLAPSSPPAAPGASVRPISSVPPASAAATPWLLGPRMRSAAPPRFEEPIDVDLGVAHDAADTSTESADALDTAIEAGDAAGVLRVGSPWIESAADARPHEVLPLARRIIRRFGADVPLGDRALALVVSAAAHDDDADVALAATRALIVRHPRSPHVAAAMWEAAGVQRRRGWNDKAENTLRNLITAYPDNPLAARARRLLAH
jgi:membrane associated rhomboid family serine protease